MAWNTLFPPLCLSFPMRDTKSYLSPPFSAHGRRTKEEAVVAYPNHSCGYRISCIIFRMQGLPEILLVPMQFLMKTLGGWSPGEGGGGMTNSQSDTLVSRAMHMGARVCARLPGSGPGGPGRCQLSTPQAGALLRPPCCLLEEAAIAQPELLRQKTAPKGNWEIIFPEESWVCAQARAGFTNTRK